MLFDKIILAIGKKRLELIEKSNFTELDVDKKSFSSGYSNGYIYGIYLNIKATTILFILLLFSLLLNLYNIL